MKQAVSRGAPRLSLEERNRLAAPLLKLAAQSLKSGRLSVASDYLELLILAAPTSQEAMGLRADLADKRGQTSKAKIYRKMMPCL